MNAQVRVNQIDLETVASNRILLNATRFNRA